MLLQINKFYGQLSEIKNLFTPSWSKLRGFGESRILKSSYFWIAFVPLTAKLFRYINNVNIEFIKLDFELPFSWQMFFWGAFFASIANLIYAFKCPDITKMFENYSEFESSGRGEQQLLNIFAVIFNKSYYKGESTTNQLCTFQDDFCEVENDWSSFENNGFELWSTIRKLNIRKDCLKNAFWYVYDFANELEVVYRRICCISYILGFLFFFYVLVQNIWFVFTNTFFK